MPLVGVFQTYDTFVCIKLSLLSFGGAHRFDPLNTPLTSTEADKLTSVAMLRTRWMERWRPCRWQYKPCALTPELAFRVEDQKTEHLYSALHGIQTTLKRSGMDHTCSFTCNKHHTCPYLVSVHQMAPEDQHTWTHTDVVKYYPLVESVWTKVGSRCVYFCAVHWVDITRYSPEKYLWLLSIRKVEKKTGERVEDEQK